MDLFSIHSLSVHFSALFLTTVCRNAHRSSANAKSSIVSNGFGGIATVKNEIRVSL